MRILVAGAGIGGLCTAIGLRHADVDVTLVEQSDSIRSGGSGLSIAANGMRALDSLGVGRAVRELTADAALLRGGQRAPSGDWLARIPPEAIAELRVIDRADLHEVLLRAVNGAGIDVRTGIRVISATADGTATLRTQEREWSEQYDLIVGADGLRSAVRASFPRDVGSRYTGYQAWRGITNRPVDLHGEAAETWGVRMRFGYVPMRDDRVYWYAVASMPQSQVFADERAELDARFGGWHDPIPDLLAATPTDRIHRLSIHKLGGPLRSFVHGRIALLGDAAHAMTPNLGQGAGMAMEDAAVLASTVSGSPADADDAVSHALAAYDAQRRERSQLIALQSSLLGRVAHLPAWLCGARDALLRAVPPSAMASGAARLVDWTPPVASNAEGHGG